jgi:enamine deaminase RidA (YjgF/YER057c/UK114 family)
MRLDHAAAGLLLALPATAAGAQEIRKANPPSVAKPVAAYSHVAEVPPGTRLLFLAGQVGNRPDGTLPATIEEQAVQALDNVRAILAAEGAGPEHIVKMTIYAAARPADMAKIAAKRAEMFRGTMPPPSTWVYVTALARPEYLIEIEAVAAVPVR